jgi:hypothetical protein
MNIHELFCSKQNVHELIGHSSTVHEQFMKSIQERFMNVHECTIKVHDFMN